MEGGLGADKEPSRGRAAHETSPTSRGRRESSSRWSGGNPSKSRNASVASGNGNGMLRNNASQDRDSGLPPPRPEQEAYEHGREFCVHMAHPEGVGPVRWMIYFPRRGAHGDNELGPLPICMLLHAKGALIKDPADHFRLCPSRLKQRYIVIVPICPQDELPRTDREPGVVSPLVYCEDSRGGFHDEKILYNESVLLRILEESILRLSLDPRVGRSRLDLQRIQMIGYSIGSCSAFNFGCMYGRFLSLVVGSEKQIE